MSATRFLRRSLPIVGVLALTLVALTLPLPAGIQDVGAQTQPHADFDSGAAFEESCTGGGGTISRTTGSIGCYYVDGSIIVCDQNGKNCTYFPAPPKPSDGSGNPFAISDDVEQVPLTEDTPTPGPSADPGNGVQIPLEEQTPTATAQEAASTAEPTAGGSEGALVPTPTPTPTVASTPEPSSNAAPADAATLSLTVRTCPAGYDPFAPGAVPQNECRDPAGAVAFRLDGAAAATATTDDVGTVQFEDLAPGEYRLTSEPAPGVAMAFVDSCQSTSRALDDHAFFPTAVAGPGGVIGLRLEPGERLACTWYLVPEAGAASVVVVLRWCPGTVINASGCDPSDAGYELMLTLSDGGEAVTVETDDDGRAVFGVPGGRYTLSQEGDRAGCLAQGEAFDEDGRLVVGDGASVEVEIYNCGALP